jgi:lipooligosaccharide transport system permease protein
MGVGLGSFVDKGTGVGMGIPYLQFLAPALLVSTIMQGAVFEATFPVMAGFRWIRRFHAMHATPVTPSAIVGGFIAWLAVHATLVGAVFTVVILVFGAARSIGVLLVVPVATLTALAFATPIAAFMAGQRDTNAFNSIWRFGVTPLFLFSGTFFPIERLPDVLRPLAWLLPLWHGVDLGRALALGTVGDDPVRHLTHVVILAVVAVLGAVWMLRAFRRQLEGTR